MKIQEVKINAPMDCLFCKITRKEIPGFIVHEDDSTIAFLDIHPLAPGHTVIIPKTHVTSIKDLATETAGPVFLTVKKVSDILSRSLTPEGFTIGINDGEAAGQGLPHLHIHLIPRWHNDKGSNIHSIVHNTPHESVESIYSKITRI